MRKQTCFQSSWQCKCFNTVVTEIDNETHKCNSCGELFKDKYPNEKHVSLEPNYKLEIVKFFDEQGDKFEGCRDMDLMVKSFNQWRDGQ